MSAFFERALHTFPERIFPAHHSQKNLPLQNPADTSTYLLPRGIPHNEKLYLQSPHLHNAVLLLEMSSPTIEIPDMHNNIHAL